MATDTTPTPAATVTFQNAKLYADFLYIPLTFGKRYLDCQFNPTQLDITKTVKYGGDPVPGRDFPRTEYGGGAAATYSLKLIFDSYAKNSYDEYTRHDVREDCNWLMSLCLKGQGYSTTAFASIPFMAEPPSVRLIWGDFQLFRAALTSCKISYTNFTIDGVPTHATADCTFTEQSHPLDFMPPQNPSSRTDPRATVRVTQGDRIDSIASGFFNDPRMWRDIAEMNELDDPFDLRPGQLLSMPLDR